MRIESTDPISLHDVPPPLEAHPYVVEGEGENALKIYFENDQNRKTYLDIPVEHPGDDFEHNLDNPVPMGVDAD